MDHPVSKHETVFTELPASAPRGSYSWKGTSVDAALLGNGDMTAAFSGPPEAPQFWVSTNDFWEMKTDNWFPENWSVGPGKPRPLGRLIFDIPALKGGSLRLRQRFVDAQTIAEYQLDGSPVLRLRSFVAASENMLLCELRA